MRARAEEYETKAINDVDQGWAAGDTDFRDTLLARAQIYATLALASATEALVRVTDHVGAGR
jgi:hypothetical protein